MGWTIKYNKGRIIYYKNKIGEPILEKRQRTKIGKTYSDNWKPGKRRYIINNSLFKLIFFLFNFLKLTIKLYNKHNRIKHIK